MTCNQGNKTLDPYQSIIDGINKSVTTLESQASIIQPFIDEFDSIADSINSPTPASAINLALNDLTADAICASSTNIAPIDKLTSDCLNEATAAIKRYSKNILSNIEEGTKLISSILTLPEGALFTGFQKILVLTGDIKDLITALNNKIECVSLSSDAADYQDQIDDINDRVNTVIDDLRLSDDGSFDSDVFLANVDSDLKDNIISYETKAQDLKSEIENSISGAINNSGTINPKNFF